MFVFVFVGWQASKSELESDGCWLYCSCDVDVVDVMDVMDVYDCVLKTIINDVLNNYGSYSC